MIFNKIGLDRYSQKLVNVVMLESTNGFFFYYCKDCYRLITTAYKEIIDLDYKIIEGENNNEADNNF